MLGIGSPEQLRAWACQAEIDQDCRPGASSKEATEVKRLERESTELRRANETLKPASALLAAELDRPSRY